MCTGTSLNEEELTNKIGLVVSVPASRPPVPGSKLGPVPTNSAVSGAADRTVNTITRVAGAALFGWSRSRFFGPAPTPTPTLQ